MMVSLTAPPLSGEQWLRANATYLATELVRLRLLLRRRLLWLRTHWARDAAAHVSWAITDQEVDLLLRGEDRQAERHFYDSDSAAIEASAALDETNGHLHALRREAAETGAALPIDILALRFGLTAFERDVLLMCLAPELDPSFERMYAYVQDDATKRFATAHLALALLADLPGAERTTFLAAGPLRHWRLVTADVQTGALKPDERVLSYVLGVNQLDGRCAGVLDRPLDAPRPASHRELATRLAQWLAAPARGSKFINLIGAADSGRLTLAQAACEQAGLGVLVIDPRLLPTSPHERRELMGVIEREALLFGSALFVDVDVLKTEEVPALIAAMGRVSVPLLAASRDRLACDHPALPVSVSRPDVRSQAELWMEMLGSANLRGDIDALVEQFDLGPAGIARAVNLALDQAALRTPDEPLRGDDLWQACRQQAGPQMEQLARKIELCYDWADIVVPREVLEQLQEITSQVAHRHQVYHGWGFAKKLSRGRGISALFAGPSGVGKTMAAEVIAHALNLDLYRIDLAGVVSKYIGETEKNLRVVFDAAERSGAILFFDEADALFGKRSDVKDSHDRYANIEINYLLQRMEDYRGLAILATNMKGSLDAAFTRRLRFIVHFPFPDATQRMEIWRRVFPREANVRELDIGLLAQLDISGGNIRNIAVGAAFLAAAEGSAIEMQHVMSAARREYGKIDRLIQDAEFGRYSEASLA